MIKFQIKFFGCDYIQLRRRTPEDEQGNARNMWRILINVLYVNK